MLKLIRENIMGNRAKLTQDRGKIEKMQRGRNLEESSLIQVIKGEITDN